MEYFEELADLIETEDETTYEDIYNAIDGSIPEDMGEILENYMDEIENGLPDEEQEIYMLVENIKTGMLFLCENLEDESTKSQLAEELFRFKNWYVEDARVIVDGKETSLIDAVATNRANKITGEESSFDFTGALDYELKDFNFSIGKFQEIDILGNDEDLENSKDYSIN